MKVTVPRYERMQRLARRFPELDASAIETCLAMLLTAQELGDAYEAHFARHGLSQGRFVVLIHLLYQEDSDGQGLSGLRRRADAFGGTLTAGRHDEAPGFRVRVEVPS